MAVIQWYQITEDYVILKFDFAVSTETLVNENFTLSIPDATPSGVDDPFDAIVVERDYQSVSRELYLYWNITLQTNTDYRLTLSNLENVFEVVIPTGYIDFSTDGINLATPNISESEFTKEPTNIEDFSIKVVADLSGTSSSSSSGITESSEEFGIISIYPDVNESYYIGPTDYQGKIEITFNHFIPSNFINNQDFKLQKKLIENRTVVAWETVAAVVAQQSDQPIVSIYLPSTDATPIYSYEVSDQTGYVFWEPGYKYRLVISKLVGY
jgi:hypothetical protein